MPHLCLCGQGHVNACKDGRLSRDSLGGVIRTLLSEHEGSAEELSLVKRGGPYS